MAKSKLVETHKKFAEQGNVAFFQKKPKTETKL
jgi:hypothetical protein